MQVIAKDTQGNEFIKAITIQEGQGYYKGELILDFGWPVQYLVSHLMESYPFQKPMCIDMMGRNHKGFQVSISAEQMDKIIEHFIMQKGTFENYPRV